MEKNNIEANNLTDKYSGEYQDDYYRMTGTKYRVDLKSMIRRFASHNLQFVFWYRKYQRTHSMAARVILYRLSKKYGLEISSRAQIGKGLYLGHPYNITVGEGVILGNNVNLHKGCTIGCTNRGNIGVPHIGDNVYIGINATVVGNIYIGNDVLIAPNSYVNIDVPDHSVVIGNPAVIHHRENATEGYVCFTV
mgnify:CR=1 FL=1